MRRDWQCIRAILAGLEAKETGQEFLRPEDLPAWDQETFSYHVNLLREAELIDALCKQLPGGPLLGVARSLTWEGHELLDRMRSDVVWSGIRKEARERGLDLSFEVVKLLTTVVLRRILGSPE